MSDEVIIRHRFETLEELTVNVLQWDLDFKQMTMDRTMSELTQIRLGPLMLTHVSTGCGHVQRGAAPPNAYTFALLVDDAQTVHWCGYSFDSNRLAFFNAGQDFEAAVYPRFSVYTLTVDPSRLDSDPAWQRLCGHMQQRGSPKRYLLESRDMAMTHLRHLVSATHRFCSSDLFRFADQDALADLGDEIVTALLAVIGAAVPARESVSAGGRSRAVRRALRYIAERPGGPIRLSQLYRSAQVPERTLQRVFLERFGVTPKAYLQALQLNGVHKDLLSCGQSGLLVRDVAIKWGFWHMGQFAGDYQRLFGELPSQTLAKTPLD